MVLWVVLHVRSKPWVVSGGWYASCFLQIRNARPTTRSKGKKAYLFNFDRWEESGGNQITMVNETRNQSEPARLEPTGLAPRKCWH